jgi:pimeloyl-ACP methyl ester carboxylesterase
MHTMAASALKKSTTVRSKNIALRAAFRAADLLAPAVAGRMARDLWFRLPPPMTPTPLPPGGEPFTVTAQGSAVRGHSFGAGPTTVYLVHGWGGLGSQLAAFVEPLVAAGHRVVLFDAPSHGASDAGPSGPGRTHGVEFGHALDAVFARFGPAEAVVAHSLGTIATYLALRFGWLGAARLVLVAPMVEAQSLFDQFQTVLGFGDRTRRAFDREVDRFVGLPIEEFDAIVQAGHVEPVPTLVVADAGDRQTPYADAVRLAESLPDAELVTTEGLGHRRILRDPAVVARVVQFVGSADRVRAA